ncbi:hypothetical protein [Bacillus phage vB_BceM_Bc431v3]|uniref:Uncharacterized protein n=1 Tax=Bacillus phage vB_BceM_Bc431v3 TaxID=1195072 RepID=M4HNI6_9CAUD|nr:hypothetical protein K201_gp111 [Bacillus phage vB_BceM_Bc431v3]AFQ96419.1 hypothetical protein [Bacillus phage vB_BceM_Bc431v3]
MELLKDGTPTPYVDKNGLKILMGDKVELEGHEFDVTQNCFSGKIVIDGDTGQESLETLAYMCEVILVNRLPIGAPDVCLSSKYKDASDLVNNIWELHNKFSDKYGLSNMPNTVYIGENLVTMLGDTQPYTVETMTIFGLKIVEVRETDHMSLGFTLTKH